MDNLDNLDAKSLSAAESSNTMLVGGWLWARLGGSAAFRINDIGEMGWWSIALTAPRPPASLDAQRTLSRKIHFRIMLIPFWVMERDEEEVSLMSGRELTFEELIALAKWPLVRFNDEEMEPWVAESQNPTR